MRLQELRLDFVLWRWKAVAILAAIVVIILLLLAYVFLGGGLEPPHPGPPQPFPPAPGPGPQPLPGPDPQPFPPGPGPGPQPPQPPPLPPDPQPLPLPPDPQPLPPGPDPQPPEPEPQEIEGTVRKIIDGDTLTIKVSGVLFPVTVHLFGVDAPEVEQRYGDLSKEYFEDIIDQVGVSVRVRVVDNKSRRSKVGWLVLSNSWVYNYETVRTGWAWEKNSSNAKLLELQQTARQNNYGLWKDTVNEEPWVWRSQNGITEEEDKDVHNEPTGTSPED